MIINYIKNLKNNTISTGVVLYSGVTNNNEIIFIDIVMPIPIKIKYYYCDKYFHISFFDKFIEQEKCKNLYLILYTTGSDAYFYEKYLTQIKLYKHISFDRQKKQKKGGQSAQRIGRIRVEKIDSFINKSIEYLNDYINNYNKNYKAVIISGNGDILTGIKSKIVNKNNNFIYANVSDKGVLFDKCDELINSSNNDFDNVKIKQYMDLLQSNPDILIFGINEILYNINNIKELLVYKNSKHYEELCDLDNVIIINNDYDGFLNDYDGIIAQSYFKLN